MKEKWKEEGREGGSFLPSARARIAFIVRCLLPSLSTLPLSEPSTESNSWE